MTEFSDSVTYEFGRFFFGNISTRGADSRMKSKSVQDSMNNRNSQNYSDILAALICAC